MASKKVRNVAGLVLNSIGLFFSGIILLIIGLFWSFVVDNFEGWSNYIEDYDFTNGCYEKFKGAIEEY